MNQKEARRVAEVVRMLQRGPGDGWHALLAGVDGVHADRTLVERERSLRCWLDSWIIPPLGTVATRYNVGKRSPKERRANG